MQKSNGLKLYGITISIEALNLHFSLLKLSNFFFLSLLSSSHSVEIKNVIAKKWLSFSFSFLSSFLSTENQRKTKRSFSFFFIRRARRMAKDLQPFNRDGLSFSYTASRRFQKIGRGSLLP